MGSIIGLDIPAVLAVADSVGVDRRIMGLFLQDIEQGLMSGVQHKEKMVGDGHA